MSFPTEKERAQKAIEEFEKVAAKYGEPYKSESRYFIASNRLVVDRQKGISELTELSNNGSGEVAALSKFALAQANESDGKLDDAARLYSELAKLNSPTVTPETANLRLAKVYEKQGKKKEAADLLFNIVDAVTKGQRIRQSAFATVLQRRVKRRRNSRNSIRIVTPNFHPKPLL